MRIKRDESPSRSGASATGLITTLILALGLASAAEAGWLHYANGVFESAQASAKHPRALTQTTVMPNDAADPLICAAYASNLPLANQGKVSMTASIERADGSTETLRLSGPLDQNLYFECTAARSDIATGDVVTFRFKFRGLPNLVRTSSRVDFFDVNGVITTAGEPGLGNIPFGVNPGEAGGWIHASNSVFTPDRDKHKHPRSLGQTIVMPRRAANPVICSGYSNTSVRRDRGSVLTTVTVFHSSGATSQLDFTGRVQDNGYAECQDGPALEAGDVLAFDYRFKSMPKLRIVGAFAESAISYAVVSVSGTPRLRGAE